MTCGRSQEFLDQKPVAPRVVRDAKKQTIDADHALDVLDGIHELFVVKGKKVIELDLRKRRPDDETLRGLLLGPTGNLRAPTLRVGHALVVGFEPDLYARLMR